MESLACFLQVHMVWGCFVQTALGRGGAQALPVVTAWQCAALEGPLEAGFLWNQSHCITCLLCGWEHPWQSQLELGPRGMAAPKENKA